MRTNRLFIQRLQESQPLFMCIWQGGTQRQEGSGKALWWTKGCFRCLPGTLKWGLTRRGASLWLVGEHIWLSLVGPELEERKEWLGIGKKLEDIDIVLILGLLLQRLWFVFPDCFLPRVLSQCFVTYGLAIVHLCSWSLEYGLWEGLSLLE